MNSPAQNRSTPSDSTTIHNAEALNYVATDPLPRDAEQSHRLHEPEQMLTSIDPITGRDIQDLEGKPYIVDGIVTIYFESAETRQAYLDEPTDHPFHLVDNPTDEGIDEG